MGKDINSCYSNLSAFNLDVKNILDTQAANPDSHSLMFETIFLLYRSGHIQPAKSLVESLIIFLEKKGIEQTLLEKSYITLAKILFNEKKYLECLSVLKKSLFINTLNSEVWFLLGKNYRQLNLETQMLNSYFRGLEIAGDLIIAYELTKELIAISIKKLSTKLELFEKFKEILNKHYYCKKNNFNFDWFIHTVENNSIKIPKVIHRVWLGKNPIPEIYENYFDEWKSLHPEWNFYTWYDKDVEDFISYDKIQVANTYAGKADIARYEILYKYGGIYLDCDIKLLKPLDYLLENSSQRFIVCNEDNLFNFHCSIGFIASVPGFYVLYDAITRLQDLNINCYQPDVSTGPLFFRQCLGYDLSEIDLISTDKFYPYLYNEPIEILNLLELNDTYGIHVWAASWQNTKNNDPQLNVEQLLAAYINRLQKIKDNIYFVVIGANDGVQNDSLTHFILTNNWQGIFVEPLPDIFLKLVLNYHQFQDRLQFENSAISDVSTSTAINRVKPIAVKRGDVPDWADGIASLHNDRNAIGGYSLGKLFEQKMDDLAYKKIEENTVSQEIKCITFQELVNKYNITEIDILQIDCEGHDYKIFEQIDLNIFKPFFVKIGVCNLTKDELELTVYKLKSHDYIIYRTVTDLYCFKKLYFSRESVEQIEANNNLEILDSNFQLRDNNLIIFPNWKQAEELVYEDLASVIKSIFTHPNKSRITLLIDNSDISDEDANFILSGVIINLLQQENLDITGEEPEISLIGQISEKQWESLLQRIHARIVLNHENKVAVTKVKAENLLIFDLEGLENQISINSASTY